MITLTDEQISVIKNGYKRVQVTVSFPDGERADITNDNIVYESLSFNESVCSSDTFRFGCAEASSVSFETVGIENILGYRIEVTLTYEYIDPENVHEILTFDVPYGVFTVTSCPRDHQNMTHRKVEALSRTSDTNNEVMPQVELDKINQMYVSKNDYEPDVWYLLDAMHGERSHSYTSTEVANKESSLSSITVSDMNYFLVTNLDPLNHYYLNISYKRKFLGIDDALYTVTGTYDSTYDDIITHVIETYTGTINESDVRDARRIGYLSISDRRDSQYMDMRAYYPGAESLANIYPYINIAESQFEFPYSISVKLYHLDEGGSTLIEDYGTLSPYTAISFTKHVATDIPFPLHLAINHTLEITNNNGKNRYSFANSYTLADIETGFAELNAGFNRRNRDGTSSVVRLDNTSPYSLTGTDVEGRAWWDEYVIADIGSIKYVWSDGQGDHEREYVWDTEGSVYDMTDNGLLRNIKLKVKTVTALNKMTDHSIYYVYSGNWYAWNGTSFEQKGAYSNKTSIVEYLLDTYFLPYADIHFTPIDMDIRGLPFLQCGDAITFTANDGTTISSYILNHTFDGIQHIKQNLDTVQGEVLQ